MSRFPLLALLASFTSFLGCASTPTAHHQTTPTGLAPHQTYAVLEHPVGGSSVDTAVEGMIHERMEARGYERASADEADVLVSYKLLMAEHEAVAPLHGPMAGLSSMTLSSWTPTSMRTKRSSC